MSEQSQGEILKNPLYRPELKKEYEAVEPIVKASEDALRGKTDVKTRKIARRTAVLSTRAKQAEVDEANQKAELAEKELGKDPLTGVLNKEKFKDELRQAVKTHVRLNRPFSVLMLDLDNFKQVNEQYGHLVGDIAIVELANLLSSEIRGIDVLGRFGGDEFALILPGSAQESAQAVSEKLRKAINLQLFGRVSSSMPGRTDAFSASIGYTSFKPNGVGKTEGSVEEITERLTHEADVALFNSKRDMDGNELKDRVTAYKEGMSIPNYAQVHTVIESNG